MRINLNHTSDTTAKNESTTFLMIRFAVTYSVFLLIILLLMVYLHRVSTTRSEQDFWDQDQSTFESAVSLLDNNFTTMDSITRQLSMNTKLYRLATMTSTDDNDFYLSGLAMKQSLASYMYSYNELPFSTYFVYLRNSGYIISVNTFNSEQLYYIRNYLSSGANFNEWHDLLNNNLTKDAAIYPLSDFMLSESDNAYLYVLNMDVLTYKDIPATVAFHISEQTFRKIFNGVSLGDTGYILAVDDQNQPVFSLCGDEFQSSEDNLSTLAESVLSLSYDGNNTCIHDDTHIMRMASKTNDWTFYLVQPESIYPSDYQIIFLFILFAAVVGGLIMIFILVRNNMRPILHLDGQLKETLHANTQLIEEAAAIRPVLYDNYLRQLMSGVITTPDEFAFIQNYLHLEDSSLHYYVLYGVTYENDPTIDTFPNENTASDSSENAKDIITNLLARYFSYENNLYLCSPKKHIYTLLIPFHEKPDKMLISLQEKVLKFHSELLEEYSIWFFAGIGLSCSFTNIWESYQQAKDAAGYTSKNYKVVTSDEFLDMIIEKGARFSWYFHYMPVGNDASTELLLDPDQREYMYHRIREIRAMKGGKPIFAFDFQNDGEYVGGCIAGGRNYCHINPNGDVEPCVFIHYSGANIKEVDLLTALKQPLFMAYRANQPFNCNHLKPCPMLENPEILQRMVHETGAHSTDLQSPESVEHLCGKCAEYAKNWDERAQKLWNK